MLEPVGDDCIGARASAAREGGQKAKRVAAKAKAKTVGARLMDLSAVEAALRAVQQDFEALNATLDTPRDPLGDEVVSNLMAGYEYLNSLLCAGVDPLEMGNSRHLLELNNLVLCGTDDLAYDDCAPHIEETRRRFYDDKSPGSVRALMNYLAEHRSDSPWRRAAGAYVHVLSQPQLFIEGNHRTGSLIMSHILAQAGKPPFVLTVENARAYFNPSSLAKDCHKHSFQMLWQVPKLRKRFASLLKDTANEGFLLRES